LSPGSSSGISRQQQQARAGQRHKRRLSPPSARSRGPRPGARGRMHAAAWQQTPGASVGCGGCRPLRFSPNARPAAPARGGSRAHRSTPASSAAAAALFAAFSLAPSFFGIVDLPAPVEKTMVCVLLLQDLLQSCSRGGRRRVEDICYETTSRGLCG